LLSVSSIRCGNLQRNSLQFKQDLPPSNGLAIFSTNRSKLKIQLAGRRKKEEGRRKKEEGRGKKEEGQVIHRC
jgi:hypothetical protein